MSALSLQSEALESGISAVIPTLNESENIPSLLQRLADALGKGGIPWEVILVDDASLDGTADLAEAAASRLDVDLRAIRRAGPRSLGLSVIEGASLAKREILVVLDADLTHDPLDVPRIVEPVLAGRADLAIGSRYAPGGRIRAWPAKRRYLSGLGTLLSRVLTPVKDPLSGFFSCRRGWFLEIASRSKPRGFKILLELLARAGPLRVEEIPIAFSDRSRGRSKLGLRQEFEFISQLLALYFRRVAHAHHYRRVCLGSRSGSRGPSLHP